MAKRSNLNQVARPTKKVLHPRNQHQGQYDFEQLRKSCPDLNAYILTNPNGQASINFADPKAVKALNQALLSHFYNVPNWKIPENYLCPPIPGRADYVHYLADLLGISNAGLIPKGSSVRVLDIGVGANCIYPIIGHREYSWSFVGVDIDPIALNSAQLIVQSNPGLSKGIELRLQSSPSDILRGVFQNQEVFDLSMNNPPFHASLEEATEGSHRKWRNLGRAQAIGKVTNRSPLLNFGGQGSELWCPGGEARFVSQMIKESIEFSTRVFWFTALISKEAHLQSIYNTLKQSRVLEWKTIEMTQGQKKSRFVAWTFLSLKQQAEWRIQRWTGKQS